MNDNTFTEKGARAMSRALRRINQLEVLFFFVCLSVYFLTVSIADPGSGAFLTPGSGMSQKSKSGSGINLPDHISEGFWVIILKFFDADPGSGVFLSLDPG